MGDLSNQHYVPQHFFRTFTGGGRSINLLLKAQDRVIFDASIRGQCAGRRFYGPDSVEHILSQLEQRHAEAIRFVIKMAWDADPPDLLDLKLADLWEAVLLQRARTALEIEKWVPSQEALLLEEFKQYLLHAPDVENRDKMVDAIDRGMVTISEDPRETIVRHVDVAMECVPLISDLEPRILRNRTDFPFVFGDAPVVFHNSYLRNVKLRGVLGLQCPGLQIVMPLDPWTLLMLIDGEVYRGYPRRQFFVEVIERSDVSMLNALQLHHSLNAVYFADRDHSEYVERLWRAHKNRIAPPRSEFRILHGWFIDGKPTEDPIYQRIEPQLNVCLDLSFLAYTPLRERDFKFRHRSPELMAIHNKRVKKRNRSGKGAQTDD